MTEQEKKSQQDIEGNFAELFPNPDIDEINANWASFTEEEKAKILRDSGMDEK